MDYYQNDMSQEKKNTEPNIVEARNLQRFSYYLPKMQNNTIVDVDLEAVWSY